MKRNPVSRAVLALVTAGAAFTVQAAAPVADDHGVHHPESATSAAPATGSGSPAQRGAAGDVVMPPAASLPALQQRMKAIRAETDPTRRRALMEEQMQAMESAMHQMPADCPMGGPMTGGGMMGGGMMGGGMMGGARNGQPPSSDGQASSPDMMRNHMQMMEQHMKMMEQMMKMHRQMQPAR